MLIKSILSIFLLLFVIFAKGQKTTSAISNEMVFVSDTQAPLWIETLLQKPGNNRFATKKIFNDISDRKPAVVYILGDVVSLGYSNKNWKPMDVYLDSLRNKGIMVHAALGNHEVLLFAKKGQKNFQQRFPDHIKTGYIHTLDSVAVVLLNSNFNKLGSEENTTQIEWYRQTLEKLDADPSILFIITGCHHSPYSNSKVAHSSKPVQQKFVTSFLLSKKSRLFLSGHAHGFEHFRQQGKDFFVIGGGGGLHQPLKKGKHALADLSANYKPLFHYLSIHRHADTLQVTSVFLKPDFTGFKEGEKQSIIYFP
ncbi:MAG: metallophosphoesterase [Chitinophagaceae bacterium]|nr:metallophosphoesterase [Chitinophagaceae bacterium]